MDSVNQLEHTHMVSVLAALCVHNHKLPKQQLGKAKQWLLLPFIATFGYRLLCACIGTGSSASTDARTGRIRSGFIEME